MCEGLGRLGILIKHRRFPWLHAGDEGRRKPRVRRDGPVDLVEPLVLLHILGPRAQAPAKVSQGRFPISQGKRSTGAFGERSRRTRGEGEGRRRAGTSVKIGSRSLKIKQLREEPSRRGMAMDGRMEYRINSRKLMETGICKSPEETRKVAKIV